MTPEELASLRKDYTMNALNEADMAATPILQFEKWWRDAEMSQITEMNAMTLAATAHDGMVDARTVLIKAFDEKGFVFLAIRN